MVILHYALGLEPERSGGLTRYVADLMQEQQLLSEVVLLYPQGWKWRSKSIELRVERPKDGIKCYRLDNSFPYPVPLKCGVASPADFMSNREMALSEMERLYCEIKPDVFHVHTLMGLPKELLMFLKAKGVKLVFTAHDYFGLCPKVNMINSKGELCSGPSEQRCLECNKSSWPTIFLRLYNSKSILNLKSYVKGRL